MLLIQIVKKIKVIYPSEFVAVVKFALKVLA